VCGIIFSNELLDALPVHRLGWDAKAGVWFEWGVTTHRGRFVWTRGIQVHRPPSALGKSGTEDASAALKGLGLPDKLLEVLPDGFTLEVCPLAEAWWRDAARALSRGKLLTIDYGFSTGEWLRPERREGTLRAYYQHRVSSDLLAQPGQQDLTAHINFSALQAAGESAGLTTESLLTQGQFLTQIAGRIWSGDAGFGEWNTERTGQFQTLTHPQHLGRAFRVLVQSKPQPCVPTVQV
jgi:SAM-dependent MidA family methyltransferase